MGWRRFAVLALVFAGVSNVSSVDARAAPPQRVPTLDAILSAYRNAMMDPGVGLPATVHESGTVAGAGLRGTFETWRSADRERDDEILGPRVERILRIGERVWLSDENDDVRELTGVFARRERTQRFIESGEFAGHPERCALQGEVKLGAMRTYALTVTQLQGEAETLYLDATTFLPEEVAYDDYDGRSTLQYSDWRSIAGRRYAFETIASDGDHAFDQTERTTSLSVDEPVTPAVFAPLVGRTIEMSSPETAVLQERESHFYVPVQIGGKTFTFLLDSGAQDVVLDRRVATELGLSSVGALEASGAARTGGVSLARVSQFVVGSGGALPDLVVSVLDLNRSTAGAFRIDGILGYPFFASSLVQFDPAERRMTFGPPNSFTPAGDRISLSTDRGFPEATLRLNGRLDAPFIIDTGSAAELLLYHPFVAQHTGLVAYSSDSAHGFGVGGATPSYRTTLAELEVGNIPLYHVATMVMLANEGAFADRFDAGNVGLGVLDNFRLTFDLSHDALFAERGTAYDDGRARN